jgi:hypothetical protein
MEFNEAFFKNDTDALLKMAADDIYWSIVGEREIRGISEFEKAINEMSGFKTRSMEIYSILTHGKLGAVNGKISGDDTSEYEFCDIYEFKSAGSGKIVKLKSFVLQTK